METTKTLQSRANALYKIEADKLSAVTNIFTRGQLQLLHTATPEEHVHHFPANAGAMGGLPFVTGAYMKHMLDRLTGGMWSFEIKEKGNASGQIWVLGRLTLYNTDGKQLVFKEQFGRASIKCKKLNGKPTDQPLDLGNDMKAAATDALKKCASELGIARDIYAANEFIEAQIVDASDVEDIAHDETHNVAQPPKVDDKYRKHVNDLLLELLPETYKRMEFIKKLTNKIRMDSLTDYDWIFLEQELTQKKLAALEPDKDESETV